MGKFDWNAQKEFVPEQNAKPSGKFNWDAQQEYKPKSDDKLDDAQAGLEHFGNAAAFGYMPQLQAVASKLAPDPNADLDEKLRAQGFKVDVKKPSYIELRDAYVKHLQDQEKDSPLSSAVGTIGGSIASGIATSALTPINAATGLGRVGQAAKAGAIIGAVSNPGEKEGEVSPLQLSDRATNAAGGAAVGGLVQGGIEGLSAAAKGVTGLGAKLTGKAEERAFKSSGAMLKDYRSANGQDRINKIGRYMLDNGLVKPGMGVSEIAAAAEKLQGEHGKAIGAILDGLDNGSVAAPTHEELAKAIDSISSPMEQMNTSQPTYNALQDISKDVRSMGRGGLVGADVKGSFNESQQVKKFISDQIEKTGGWKTPNPTEKNLALRQAYGQVNQAIESAADNAAKSVGDENLLKQYQTAKDGYRNASDVYKIASEKELRNNANNFFSIGDKIGAGTGFVGGYSSGNDTEDKLKKGIQGAAIGYAANKLATHGTPLVSNLLDAAGSKLSQSVLPEIGEMISPALSASEKSRISPAMVEAIASTPKLSPSQLKVAKSKDQDRAPSELKGYEKFMQDGADKLGIDSATATSKEAQLLLLEAHSLPANSKRLQLIKTKLQGLGK